MGFMGSMDFIGATGFIGTIRRVFLLWPCKCGDSWKVQLEWSMRTRLTQFLAVLVLASASGASAREVCRFAGTTDYSGQVAIVSDVAANGGVTTVDVTVTFAAKTHFWLPVRYLIEETSTWKGGELQSVAVNNRYLVAGIVIRQLWDDFQRTPDGIQGRRVQGKNLGDFRRKHPGFVQHWDAAMFGQPWLQDFSPAPPERRADLDLGPPLPAGLRSPFAMAVYWVRWLPRGGATVPVFLPGFKADKLAELPVTGIAAADGTHWRAPLNYFASQNGAPSTATAWTSPDQHLLQLTFDVHGAQGSARGEIHQEGCDGAPVLPPGWR
jgi:hypothetical protein